MITSENVNELFAALSKAQGEFKSAKKDSQNPFFKSHYSDLASVISVIREPLARHGLAIIQGLHGNEFHTMLAHSSGQFIKLIEPFVPQKNDPQSVGSLKSYIRRYSILSLLCIATDDDDGESAMTRVETSHPVVPVQKQSFEVTGGISQAQAKRFHALASKHNWTIDETKKLLLAECGVDSSLKIPREKYDHVCNLLGQRASPTMGDDTSWDQ